MRVLIACEESGTVREAFNALGHEAWSCDVIPTSRPGNHIQDDVVNHLGEGWDLMIAHPPCTRLSNSGVCWLHARNLWNDLDSACRFFRALLESDIPKLAIENPIPHKYALERIGRKYDQTIQPWDFGHMESKRTCLWLKNLPILLPTSDLRAETMKLPPSQRQRLHWLPKTKDRARLRSKTFEGIAQAMAQQWGNL